MPFCAYCGLVSRFYYFKGILESCLALLTTVDGSFRRAWTIGRVSAHITSCALADLSAEFTYNWLTGVPSGCYHNTRALSF